MLAYHDKPTGSWTPVKILCVANLAVASLALFCWPLVAPYIAQPVGSAAESGLSVTVRPNLWNYPYLLVWAFPLIGAWLSYVLQKAKFTDAARFFGGLPITLIASCGLWYWLFQLTNYGDEFYRAMSGVLATDPRTLMVWTAGICGLLLATISSIAGMRDLSKYFVAVPLFGVPGYYAWVFLVENSSHWLPQILSFG